MIKRDKNGWKGYRARAAVFSMRLGIIAVVCTLQAPNSIVTVDAQVARECAAWANKAFTSPSAVRDEALIDCIERPGPPVTPEEIDAEFESRNGEPEEVGNELEAGAEEGSANPLMAGVTLPAAPDRLMTGETPPVMPDPLMAGVTLPGTPDPDCAFLRVAVQSPAGSDEVAQKPMRDLFSTALTLEGFNVVESGEMHHWWASSLTLDTGVNSAAWTILVRATPEIGNGSIQFTTVDKTVDGRDGSFSGMQSLRAFGKDQAPEAARLAAESIANALLPAAHRRCGDIGATLEAKAMRLEQLRSELTQEIERVQRERAQRGDDIRDKQLEIEVEG